MKELNVRLETVKLLEENREKSSRHWSLQLLHVNDTKSTGHKIINK